MQTHLTVSVGQASDKGVKAVNQDFYGVLIPEDHLLASKGIAIALADGISSSSVSQLASSAVVKSFLDDYFCTSEAWSVKKSALQVLLASNSWLYAQSRRSEFRSDMNRGYVCTFSGLIIKSSTAHLFHVGDTRVYRIQGNRLEQLTTDHRYYASAEKSYLTRAMGMEQQLDLDYQSLTVQAGDTFILATDGIYEFVNAQRITEIIASNATDLQSAAEEILQAAMDNASDDNLTIQIIRIDNTPAANTDDIHQQLTELPFPPELNPRDEFDGYRILRKVHSSPRSHVYAAQDIDSGEQVIIKTPSGELRDNTAYLERFLMEEWIARRIDSAHVLKPVKNKRKPNYLYVATEFIEGITLAQWMRDNPRPQLDEVRNIIEQTAAGLRAFHRLEMLHQDLKPDNIMIDKNGTVKIIDFGSVRVAGILEIDTPVERLELLGTAQYSAPEYFLGVSGTPASDVFALGVITYQMLTGRLPYGTAVSKARTAKAQNRLSYPPIHFIDEATEIPHWVDMAIKKSLTPEPHKRYQEPSEFMYDLSHPNKQFLRLAKEPLLQRNPVQFWQGVSLLLAIAVVVLLYRDLS
ncbi:MAG: protein kinase [Oceanospirillaceae bacterium]|uniref:bifunctional protein-serine/threonine kinase/phosphatase n=1 Tax=unclassified Thalassolituus TaxID=2624967 RepID=UPI000C65208A|nr:MULTISPECIES: bifunctional protein-serine/threonine kinase/phosphatase [unclassified Thalassolituus]MAS26585.1 protein kinase [Oceanospirillaceae bacterium]MBL34192.1 protein kinase [Oceanospirillaceae bacterium]MBS52075.1 protein kinase [Oceanospirillaceae bacterium]|tara:strand:- start:207 stop:1943 length:1737 start_codon:yes stop_codon:yes gene_type:complete